MVGIGLTDLPTLGTHIRGNFEVLAQLSLKLRKYRSNKIVIKSICS